MEAETTQTSAVLAVEAVQTVESAVAVDAVPRIPHPQRRAVTYYSVFDHWLFDATLDSRVCELCRACEEIGTFRGDQLRTWFPSHEIVDENTIRANMHPHCRCYLLREITEEIPR